MQETFIGFLTSLPNFDESRELQTYLFTIASYKLTDHLRKSGRHPMQHVSDGADAGSSHLLHQKLDSHKAASSVARSHERKGLESDAISRSLTHLLEQWRAARGICAHQGAGAAFRQGLGESRRGGFLKISEQQVANIRFAAVKKFDRACQERRIAGGRLPRTPGGSVSVITREMLSRLHRRCPRRRRRSPASNRRCATRSRCACSSSILLQERDRGEHSVGAIWRRQRLSCVKREQLGSYLLGVLDDDVQDYIQFHLRTIGCAYCLANLADLQTQQQHDADGSGEEAAQALFPVERGVVAGAGEEEKEVISPSPQASAASLRGHVAP